jgi:hypothetical protein
MLVDRPLHFKVMCYAAIAGIEGWPPGINKNNKGFSRNKQIQIFIPCCPTQSRLASYCQNDSPEHLETLIPHSLHLREALQGPPSGMSMAVTTAPKVFCTASPTFRAINVPPSSSTCASVTSVEMEVIKEKLLPFSHFPNEKLVAQHSGLISLDHCAVLQRQQACGLWVRSQILKLDGICCPLPLTLCNYFINLLKVRKALRA